MPLVDPVIRDTLPLSDGADDEFRYRASCGATAAAGSCSFLNADEYSGCVSIREPFGISVRRVLGQSLVPLRPPSGEA